MITWFIKELALTYEQVAEILNRYPTGQIYLNSKDVKHMTLGRRKWPKDTWNALRFFTSHLIANVQTRVELLNKTRASQYRVGSEELSSRSCRLCVVMACILLAGNTPVLLD